MTYDLVRLGQEVAMTVNSISEAKAHFSALIEEVSKGNDVIIGRAGKPIAVLTPFTRQLQPRTPGSLRGKIRIGADFDVLPEDIASAFGVTPS